MVKLAKIRTRCERGRQDNSRQDQLIERGDRERGGWEGRERGK